MHLPLSSLSSFSPGAATGRRGRAVRGAAALLLGGLAVAGCSTTSAPAALSGSPSSSPSGSAPTVPTGAPSSPALHSPAVHTPAHTPAHTPETAPPLGQPACAGSELTVVDADAVTAQGTLQEIFVVRTSGPDCQLVGYPGLTFVGAAGKILTVRVDQGGHGLPPGAPGPVTLSKGTSMSFTVATATSGACEPTSRVRVTLPATTPPLSVDTSIRVCGGVVGVSPVQRRSDAD